MGRLMQTCLETPHPSTLPLLGCDLPGLFEVAEPTRSLLWGILTLPPRISSPSLSQIHLSPSLTKAEAPQMLTLLESFSQKASLNRRVSAKSLAASLLGVMATDEDRGWKDTPFP